MAAEKLIIIGCDDTASLSAILGSMNRFAAFPRSIISVTKVTDLIDLVRSLKPHLVLLYFRNNQLTLNSFNSFVKTPTIPVLCLTKRFETETLTWPDTHIVFTYPFENLPNEKHLHSRINSILLLRGDEVNPQTDQTLTQAAIQESYQPDKSRNLSRYVMELDQKVEVMLKVKDRIASLYSRVDDRTRAELTSIVHSIKTSANDNKLWEDFKMYFEQTAPDFLVSLSKRYPVLTPIDLKYCCYLKMNMSNDDIRNLLGINQDSVRTHKYRLKKKMSLPKDQDLRSFLRNVGQKEYN